ncbi:MAG TPA: glycosyltransferase, partial [Bryobacteraceae bacterium]|nr:glycosyltransferase [Bryobacteraceae bacterium]
MKRLNFLFFDAGGGHRAAANALRATIEKERAPFQVELINLQELLDEFDIFRKISGRRVQDIYNNILKKGWTLGSAYLLKVVQLAARIYRKATVRKLQALWRQNRPDMVISLIPNFNRAIFESVQEALPGVPLVTIITDFADYPPHFWIEPQDQHMICGSDRAEQQALAAGLSPSKVFRVSGMILNPRFYDLSPLTAEERAARRTQLGLRPDQPVGLVLFGGQGAEVMSEIARNLDNRQLILICGKNEELAGRLRATPHTAPIFVEGFTTDVPRYMQIADYFIGKPGPGSISEAMAMHLPAIVERNAWTMPQERYNTEWLIENSVGMVLPNFRGIAKAVDQLLEPATYAKYRAATEALHNRAVFEIVERLQHILDVKPAESGNDA